MRVMQEDWRIFDQKDYLYKKTLFKTKFKATKSCDHVHCVFCWDKFGESEEMLHEGYTTECGHHWICETCFHDFNEDFEWTVSFPLT